MRFDNCEEWKKVQNTILPRSGQEFIIFIKDEAVASSPFYLPAFVGLPDP